MRDGIWHFVILKRAKLHKYSYFVSKSFNSTNIDDLKDIYKNLLFIKNEITKATQRNINL